MKYKGESPHHEESGLQTQAAFFVGQMWNKWLTVLSFKKLYDKVVSTKKKDLLSQVFLFGGDGRDRTVDLLNAIQALSQLSYAPGFLTA